jgi:hypothetical protein
MRTVELLLQNAWSVAAIEPTGSLAFGPASQLLSALRYEYQMRLLQKQG